jgi:hypothetical protein
MAGMVGIGDIPADGSWTMDALADAIISNEQWGHAKLTALKMDQGSNPVTNVCTFIAWHSPIGALSIVAAGAQSAGQKLFSASIYASGNPTNVDVYRLPKS